MLYKTAFEGFSCLEYAKRNCQPGSKLLHECYTAGKVQCVSSRDITSLKHTLVYSEYGQTMENCKNILFLRRCWQKVDINYHPTVTRAAPFSTPFPLPALLFCKQLLWFAY